MISTREEEGEYQASKWSKFPVLCEPEELALLFARLEPFSLFHLGSIGDGKPLSSVLFLQEYGKWVEGLQKGIAPSEASLRRYFASVFADDPSAVWLQEIGEKGFLVRLRRPLLQMQAHFFTYSSVDGEIRSLSMGERSIFWGIQFSYPQVYQDGKSGEICKAEGGELLKTIRSWQRDATVPAVFSTPSGEKKPPFRLGKKSREWIGGYAALKNEGLVIHG